MGCLLFVAGVCLGGCVGAFIVVWLINKGVEEVVGRALW